MYAQHVEGFFGSLFAKTVIMLIIGIKAEFHCQIHVPLDSIDADINKSRECFEQFFICLSTMMNCTTTVLV